MKLLMTLIAGLALAAFPAARAEAADDTTPCAGITATDAKGDQAMYPAPFWPVTAPKSAGPENADVKRLWFNTRDGVTTAHIEIANLTKDVPAEAAPNGALTWSVWFKFDGLTYYVKAVSDGSAVKYKWGGYQYVVSGAGSFVLGENGDIKGSFQEGPNGVISLELPADLAAKPGSKLEGVSARVAFKKADGDVAYNLDRAPDAAADDKTATLAECPAADPAPVPSPVVDPPPAPPAPSPEAPAAAPAPAPAAPAAPASKPTPKKKKATCASKVRKLKGKRRAKAMKVCKKKAKAQKRK